MGVEQWEYLTTFMTADIDNPGAREYMAMYWPGEKKAQYAPQSLVPAMNDLGREGWELVHMEPVAKVGSKGDVGFITGQGLTTEWSNYYFCVFKRRR